MSANVITLCHSLELIPVQDLLTFARIGSIVRAVLPAGKNAIPSGAIPGSVKVSQTLKDGIVSKSITYEIAAPSATAEDFLNRLSHCRLVAVYVDEVSNKMVCGSPDYPLRLEYTRGEGVYTVTLSGKDSATDGFMAV